MKTSFLQVFEVDTIWNMLLGYEARTPGAASLQRVTCPFLRKRLVAGKILFPQYVA